MGRGKPYQYDEGLSPSPLQLSPEGAMARGSGA